MSRSPTQSRQAILMIEPAHDAQDLNDIRYCSPYWADGILESSQRALTMT